MQKLSELSQYMYELVPFRASQLFYNLDWKINGGKCTCLTMQSDFIVQKMSRSIGKMKLCGLYRPKKVQRYGYNIKVTTIPSRKSPEFWTQTGPGKDSGLRT